MLKLLLSGLAIGLTLAAFIPYILSIVRGHTRPHVFSWVIWGITTCVVFAAQLNAGGGRGAIPIGVSGGITLLIALLAFYKRADINITRSDWFFFLAALGAIPAWYLLRDPLAAVVLLTTIDILGFGPTLRKAFSQPQQEPLWFYALFLLRNLAAAAALDTYSLTTLLFPLAISAACTLAITILVIRRRHLRHH